MSFHVLFAFSTGFTAPIKAPKGTHARILAHVEELETTLRLIRVRPYAPEGQEPVGWRWANLGQRLADYKDEANNYRSDETLCNLLMKHRRWVKRFYDDLSEWQEKPPTPFEKITPKQAVEWWHALATPEPPLDRWSREYYVQQMEFAYEALRGRDNGDAWTFDAPALTEKQAAAVIGVFAQLIDRHDMRLDAPHDLDSLRSSYDGGYTWCETCGAVAEEYLDEARAGQCGRASKRKCNLYREAKDEDQRDAEHRKKQAARHMTDLIQDAREHGEKGSATLQQVLDLLEIPKGWRRQNRQLEVWRTLQQAVRLGWLEVSKTTPPIYTRTNKSTGRTGRL